MSMNPLTYITNADKGTDHNIAILRAELETLHIAPNGVIITLGDEAQEAVESVKPKVRVHALPHPMYWRRFKWGMREEYIKKLMNAIGPSFTLEEKAV